MRFSSPRALLIPAFFILASCGGSGGSDTGAQQPAKPAPVSSQPPVVPLVPAAPTPTASPSLEATATPAPVPAATPVVVTSAAPPYATYYGAFTYASGGKRGAKIALEAGSSSSPTTASEIAVLVKLDYANGGSEWFDQATWSVSREEFNASGPAMTSLGKPNLVCEQRALGTLDCTLSFGSSKAGKGAFIANITPPTVATPVPVATPKPTPAPTPTATPSPIVSTTDADGNVSKIYAGRAEFKSSFGKDTRDITLKVVRDPQGGVRVGYRVTASGVGADFHTCFYDATKRTLIATEPMKIGTLAGALTLSCQNFSIDSSNYDFACAYESTTADVTGDFTFKGP